MTTVTVKATNPYVGPRSFRYGEILHGRDREVAEILDLLIAERIVLLFSPSGAGKTSLIQAGLAPQLEAEQFEVLPIIRVTHELPPGEGDLRPRNRYLASTLLSLEERVPEAGQRRLDELAAMSLCDYLAQRPDLDGRPGNEVLIFDQFEEVLIADPTDQEAKREFFAEVGAALRDRDHWALFSMREDFLGGLDPFLRLLPTRLATRCRLDLLTPEPARVAITYPARQAGVVFTDAAADKLIDDLRRVRVQRPDGSSEELGPYIEPVQLQVACRRVWDHLAEDATEIDIADIEAAGDVDRALADYYSDCVRAVAAATVITERRLRDWFESELITPQGFRNQVLHGPLTDRARDSEILRRVMNAHLIRAESRRGAVWYELAHDRLIDPIKKDNVAWRERHLTSFQRDAALWASQQRPDGLLLSDDALQQCEASLASSAEAPTAVEQEFLDASLRARSERERERRAVVRTRRFLVLAVSGFIVALIALGFALASQSRASDAKARAEAQTRVAQEREVLAASSAQLFYDTDLSLLLAHQVASTARDLDDRLAADAWAKLQEAMNQTPVEVVLSGHDGAATAVAFEPDSPGRALTSGADGTLRLWDTQSGRQLRIFEGDGTAAGCIAIGPNGNRVASGDANGIVQVWDRAAPKEPRRFDDHEGIVYAVTFSPDGETVASASADGSVRLWTIETGVARVLRVDQPSGERPSEINDVVFTPDGRFVVAGSDDGTVRFWDVASGVEDESRRIAASSDLVLAVDISSDGQLLATAGADGSAKVWDVATGVERLPIDNASPTFGSIDVALSRDGARVATIGESGNVAIYDTASGAGPLMFGVIGSRANSLAFDPSNNARLAVISDDGAAAVWDVRVGHADLVNAIDVSRVGTVATASDDGTAKLWSAAGRELYTLTGHDGPVEDAAFSPDARTVATAGDDGTVRLWEVATGRELQQFGPQEGIVWSVSFSADGTLLAAGGDDSIVHIWNVRNGRQVRSLDAHSAAVYSVAFSPVRGDPRLVSGGSDRIAIVWDTATGKHEPPLRHDGEVVQVDFSPRGDRVVTAAVGDDLPQGTLQLWDIETGLPTNLKRHTKPVADVAFDATGERLVTTSWEERTVIVWNVSSRQPIARMDDARGITHVAFDADGRHIYFARFDGPLYSYALGHDELLRDAAARTTRAMTRAECDRYDIHPCRAQR